MMKFLKFGLISTATVTGCAYVFPDQFQPVSKVLNVGYAGSKMYWVYKHTNDQIQIKNAKAATYLRDALRSNGGLYLKLGQLIATLDVIVPDEYRLVLGTLTRDCPVSNIDQIMKMLKDQTGKTIKDLFSQFNPVPISSASIGQVHKGRLLTGQEVAIKIQHPTLSDNVEYDLRLMRTFVAIANRLFQDFKYNWLLEQFEKNIRIELDFVHEAQNTKRLEKFIKQQKLKNMCVPKIYNPTTKKLLIMEFIHGYHIDQIQQMKNHNMDLSFIGKVFANLVIKMIHKKGFVHGDPHAGNLKVRLNKKGQPQLVILDHGLYQELSSDIRKKYNKFWLGLILNDQSIYDEAARSLGAKNPKILCSMLTSKTQQQLNSKQRTIYDLNPSSDRSLIMLQAQKNHVKIVDTLNQLRREILLLLKVNQFARTIENVLGGRKFGVYQDIAYQCVNNLDLSWWRRIYYYWRMFWAH